MALSSTLVGIESEPVNLSLDPRWTMNFAAGIGDLNLRLFDTRAERLPVHPMILAHPEWEATKLLKDEMRLLPEESTQAVEVTHDTRLYRPMFGWDQVVTRARVIGVERHRSGAWMTVQYDTTATLTNELVATTVTGIIYRGVDVDGPDAPAQVATPPAAVLTPEPATVELEFGPAACHIYSECSRIWNAIHTDIAVAEKAGLPGLILHGSATLARGTSEIINRVLGGYPERVTRIYGEFRSMLIVPAQPTLEYSQGTEGPEELTSFRIVTPTGGLAIANGCIEHGTITD